MAPSLSLRNSYVSSQGRPGTRDTNRPVTREQQQNAGENAFVPSRTSSLHSRITQPLPSTLTTGKRPTPKTLTHAYLVCGVGREPSQWVKAPVPAQGKIQHMKGAVGQFWLPEILGSSPRLESDNEIARSLHGAMRVFIHLKSQFITQLTLARPVSLMTLKFAPAAASPTVFTTHLFSNKIPSTPFTVLLCGYGLALMKDEQRPSGISVARQNPTTEM